jgi:hypothetical protein
MNTRVRYRTSLGLGLLLAVISLLAGGGTGRAVAVGQPAAAILTLVDANGRLLALPEGVPPVMLSAETVTDLAWHPAVPEVLLVRQRLVPGEGPLDRIVRVDLTTGVEQELLAMTGPQPRLVRPHYGPDGGWAYVEISCCLPGADR